MWTEERVEQLRQLWSDGLSAKKIAKQLGGITRNAVIGKARRLKLSNRAAVRVVKRNSRPIRPTPVYDPRHVRLPDLMSNMCKWPIGDPRHSDFHFCGGDTQVGASYCDHHCTIAYYQEKKEAE